MLLVMRSVNIDLLKAEIARPDQLKHIAPLRRFRGNLTERQAASMWNFVNAMFLTECESRAEGQKLFAMDGVGHLCGSHSKGVNTSSISSFCNRIRLSPKVAAMVPGLHDYASSLVMWRFDLEECGALNTLQKKNAAVMRQLKSIDSRSQFYPFLSKADREHALLKAVHEAVPSKVNFRIRADLCQDLAVAVLAGELSIENLPDAVSRYLRNARSFMPKTDNGVFSRNSFGGVCMTENEYGDRYFEAEYHRHTHAASWQESYNSKDYAPYECDEALSSRVEELRDRWGCDHQ